MVTTYVAFDLETTGLSPRTDHILEIGAIKVEDGDVTGTYETFLNNGVEIPERIVELTGITEEMAASGKDPAEAVRGFLEFAGDAVLLGHNVLFDYSFMKRAVVNMGGTFERHGLDTLGLARILLPQMPKKSLDQMAAHYEIPQEHHHRALDDALTTARVYERLREEFGESRPDLFEEALLKFKMKKESPITNSQKGYLRDLLKYHKIESNVKIEEMTKNEASRMIDGIILKHGKMKR